MVWKFFTFSSHQKKEDGQEPPQHSFKRCWQQDMLCSVCIAGLSARKSLCFKGLRHRVCVLCELSVSPTLQRGGQGQLGEAPLQPGEASAVVRSAGSRPGGGSENAGSVG